MKLPEGVERVVVRKPNGKVHTYYYWNPGRGTKREGERIQLPNADRHPDAFWNEVSRRTNDRKAEYVERGSIGELVRKFRSSDEFQRLEASTKRNYDVSLRRFESAWGRLPAKDLQPVAVMAARDAMTDTPVMANQTLAVGRTMYDWAIPLGLADLNPFDKIRDLDVPDRGHVPWPDWVFDHVCTHAPPDLVRAVRLARMTCQRGSDIVRMGPGQRDRNGLWCRPKKTKKRRRAFHIPLATADAIELDRWAETPLLFTSKRFATAQERHRDDLYFYSPKGGPYTPDSLRARWGRWLEQTAPGRALRDRWKEWIAIQIGRYDWDIDPEEARHPTLHGLRGTGILARLEQGYDIDQIVNDIGMSRPMVARYIRFRDQMRLGADGQRRLHLVGNAP